MFTWKRFGGYEVSTKGDKRFSAFYARLGDGRTIEQHYQCDCKGYDPGGTDWRLGKGKPPKYPKTPVQLWQEYLEFWREWVEFNPGLFIELYHAVIQHHHVHGEGVDFVLSDRFATTEINQARALAQLLNERYNED
jgi:hypothetical protein